MKPILTSLSVLLLSMSASAQITGTFVSAVDGVNSFMSSDGISTFSTPTATAGFWHDRPGTFDIAGMAAPASGAYQGQVTTSTHNEVVTTITGLSASASYDIYMIMGVNTNGPVGGLQNIDAGFASGALTTLLEAAGTDTNLFLMAGGTWKAYEHLIGNANADANGEIKVYVNAATGAERSVYNGLSYDLTTPAMNTGNPTCDGSTGQCPCFTVGMVGHGCPNSNSSNGGKLVGTGNAAVTSANDTFALTASECSAINAGLILSGTADLSPGINTINDNAGLLCVGGMTLRGSVVFTDASGNASFPNFLGAQYGQASNASANMLTTYQYWYRDPGTACAPNDTASSDFNFTNVWAVTFLP